jgi:hypothetical protein
LPILNGSHSYMCADGTGSAGYSTNIGMLPNQHGWIIGTHRAAALLRERGLIITVHGRGTYVA